MVTSLRAAALGLGFSVSILAVAVAQDHPAAGLSIPQSSLTDAEHARAIALAEPQSTVSTASALHPDSARNTGTNRVVVTDVQAVGVDKVNERLAVVTSYQYEGNITINRLVDLNSGRVVGSKAALLAQYRGRLESGIHAQPGEPVREGGAGGGGGGVGIPLRNVAAAIADPLGKPLPANIKTLDDALAAGLLPKGPPYGNGTGHPWQVGGYQFDIYDSPAGNIGALYEGQGRGFSANTGEVVYLTADANNNVVKTILGRTSDLTGPQYYKQGDWNQIEIIARGNTLVHMLNGKVFCVVIDDDAGRRALKGIISLQLEGPADNEVWYRNIWLKKL